MVAIRISNSMNALRAACTRAPQTYRTFTTGSRCYAQGYGDGKGNPIQDNPQSQPPSSDLQQASEHPGPDPPDVGQKANSGPTKAGLNKSMKDAAARESGQKQPKTPEDASAQSGGSRSKEATETGGSPTGGSIANAASQSGGEALKGPQGKGAPSPKIYNQAIPAVKSGLSDEQKQEVERHNADFEKRHDRAAPASEDKVDPKFWKGT
ncbi:uncharacterized protein GGS22DRAFT_168234 [Annulohypoxylon maeteangense]|uniref:uncharacterized protein n=1 Tax=Annulohypoxylon maeteangense TaxID=1927788 RepID=UPI0020079214|nr:uncharacterized protein GGS22DRAFT_168234 [Annulohypoxylon maeteangense]KAI0883250.1 hypothetical protein GGS22DRAFT_168234 [Annulohypoxylon maeteangense]